MRLLSEAYVNWNVLLDCEIREDGIKKMSLWWSKQDKSRRRVLWQIDFDPLILMLVIGLLATLVAPSLFRNPSMIIMFSFGVLAVGLICLIISKISLYRKGIWLSFGPRLMSKGYAELYKAAYVLLGIGGLLMLLLLDALRKV